MRSSRERRAAERRWIYRDALLSIPRLMGVYSCGVRDLRTRALAYGSMTFRFCQPSLTFRSTISAPRSRAS